MTPARAPTINVRSLAAAALVAAAVGALFPYVTLALGFGPNSSLIATFFGVAATAAVGAHGRGALAASHAAGVAAAQTAVMGTALAAFDLLHRAGAIDRGAPRPAVTFAWLATCGALGLVAALPLRRHFIVDEALPFAAGEAAGEAIATLADDDSGSGPGATPRDRTAHRVFGGALATAAAATLARLPLSPLGIGSGLLVGPRVALSIGGGALLAWLAPPAHVATAATALLVAGGLTRAVLRAPALVRSFGCTIGGGLARPRAWWLAIAAGVAALCAIDRVAFAMSIPATLACAALAAPLVLVGARVLGETNWAPVASLAVVAQALLATLAPGAALVNLAGSTVAAAIPCSAQHALQSFRAAAYCGTRPRDTAVAHLVGAVVGAATLAVAYPLLAARFGIGQGGLASPLAVAWADVTAAVTHTGCGADLGGELAPLAIAGGTGVALALIESSPWRWRAYIPSPIGLGIGLVVPARFALAVALGGALDATRLHASPRRITAAAGLVAGEALAATLSAFV